MDKIKLSEIDEMVDQFQHYRECEILHDTDCEEIFKEEMSDLKQWITKEEIFINPKLIEALYEVSKIQMKELDQLNARGTSIESLTMSVIKMRALIIKISTDLNLDHQARWSKNEQ